MIFHWKVGLENKQECRNTYRLREGENLVFWVVADLSFGGSLFMTRIRRSLHNQTTLEVDCCEKGASKWWTRIFASWVAVLTSLPTKISDAIAPFGFGRKTAARKTILLSLMPYLSGQDIQPKRDLTRFVKWPRYIRLQRQRAILYKRLKVPPAVNQFTQALDRQTGKLWFFPPLFNYKRKEAERRILTLAKFKATSEKKNTGLPVCR